MALTPLVATIFTIPGVTNPITDILPNYAGSTPGGGTFQGGTGTDTVSPGTQAIQSCVVGGVAGAVGGAAAGAAIGAIFFGIGAIPGAAIGGLIGGGALGCGIGAIFFPQQGSAVFNQVKNSTGVLGDFLQALVIALSYFGPLVKFINDSATYELAILSVAPEIGTFLLPLQALTIIWLFYTIALYVRGLGTTSA